MILLFTYDGWSDVTLVAGEVKDPGQEHRPRRAARDRSSSRSSTA